jgi:predicted small secreted protein
MKKSAWVILIGLVLAVVGTGCDLYTGGGYDYGYYYEPSPVYYAPSIYCETVCDYYECWEECY